MSINSLQDNPIILQELATAIIPYSPSSLLAAGQQQQTAQSAEVINVMPPVTVTGISVGNLLSVSVAFSFVPTSGVVSFNLFFDNTIVSSLNWTSSQSAISTPTTLFLVGAATAGSHIIKVQADKSGGLVTTTADYCTYMIGQ